MKIRIQEAYWGAWKQYGWAKGIWGIGLDAKKVELALKRKQSIQLKIYNFPETFVVSPRTVINYAKKNKTTKMARKTKLYIVPQTLLKKIIDPNHSKSISEEKDTVETGVGLPLFDKKPLEAKLEGIQ